MADVLSPSDLQHLTSDSACVGGRVTYVDPQAVILSDALGSVHLWLSASQQAAVGDILVVEAERSPEGRWRLKNVSARQRHPEPRGDGEWLRLNASGRGQLLQARARAKRVVRRYFEEQDFLEVDTPTFVPCPGLDAHVHSLAPVALGENTYHLITSPELHMKRLLTGGMPRIYQLARCFRAEELGAQHEPEFTLVEWYRAFSAPEEIMTDTEALVRNVVRAIGSKEFYNSLGDAPFLRLTVQDAFKTFAEELDALALSIDDPDKFFQLLVDQVEPGLTSLGRPVFLTDFPLNQAALARPKKGNTQVAERFELYVNGVELANGYGELTDPEKQQSRFEMELERRKAASDPLYPIDERFLSALWEGLPPAAGNALGLDRLIALATGTGHISQTLSFSHEER